MMHDDGPAWKRQRGSAVHPAHLQVGRVECPSLANSTSGDKNPTEDLGGGGGLVPDPGPV